MTLERLHQEAIGLLKSIINTPSYSGEEGKVADVLSAFIVSRGFDVQRWKNNVAILPKPVSNKPTLLLNSHLDTVKPTASWNKNPHRASEEGDLLYGLGSNDAGASLVSLLMTYLSLAKTKQAYNLVYLASAEEEISGKNGVEHALNFLPKIDFAIVGEPTEMQPAVAEKGLMVIDAATIGKSGHAAREEGLNAIYLAMEDLSWASTFHFPKVSDLLGAVKMSVTQISAGERHNVIPDRCHYVMDIRSNELYNNEEIFDIIDRNTHAELKARSFRLSSSFTDPKHPFLLRSKDRGLKPYGSPTLSDQCLMPFPSIKMGPGHSARSHAADEYIKKSEIKAGIGTYLALLDGLVF